MGKDNINKDDLYRNSTQAQTTLKRQQKQYNTNLEIQQRINNNNQHKRDTINQETSSWNSIFQAPMNNQNTYTMDYQQYDNSKQQKIENYYKIQSELMKKQNKNITSSNNGSKSETLENETKRENYPQLSRQSPPSRMFSLFQQNEIAPNIQQADIQTIFQNRQWMSNPTINNIHHFQQAELLKLLTGEPYRGGNNQTLLSQPTAFQKQLSNQIQTPNIQTNIQAPNIQTPNIQTNIQTPNIQSNIQTNIQTNIHQNTQNIPDINNTTESAITSQKLNLMALQGGIPNPHLETTMVNTENMMNQEPISTNYISNQPTLNTNLLNNNQLQTFNMFESFLTPTTTNTLALSNARNYETKQDKTPNLENFQIPFTRSGTDVQNLSEPYNKDAIQLFNQNQIEPMTQQQTHQNVTVKHQDDYSYHIEIKTKSAKRYETGSIPVIISNSHTYSVRITLVSPNHQNIPSFFHPNHIRLLLFNANRKVLEKALHLTNEPTFADLTNTAQMGQICSPTNILAKIEFELKFLKTTKQLKESDGVHLGIATYPHIRYQPYEKQSLRKKHRLKFVQSFGNPTLLCISPISFKILSRKE